MTNSTDLAKNSLRMARSIQDNLNTPRSQDREDSSGQTAQSMTASGSKIKLMEKVLTSGQMVKSTLVIGKMA
jgi:hypothetical protein